MFNFCFFFDPPVRRLRRACYIQKLVLCGSGRGSSSITYELYLLILILAVLYALLLPKTWPRGGEQDVQFPRICLIRRFQVA